VPIEVEQQHQQRQKKRPKKSHLRAGKLADSGYVSIFDKDKVNIYDMPNTEITVSRSAILKG